MSTTTVQDLELIRESVRALCEKFPESYWRETDEKDHIQKNLFNRLRMKAGYLPSFRKIMVGQVLEC